MANKKTLLSIEDLDVKFKVRGRILTAIRGISLDIYEGESIAIVGESGSGKSVFTKTFAGMLDSNGFIDNGKIIFNDEELADTKVKLDGVAVRKIRSLRDKLDKLSKFELGGNTKKQINIIEKKKEEALVGNDDDLERVNIELKALNDEKVDLENEKQILDRKKDKGRIAEINERVSEIVKMEKEKQTFLKEYAKKMIKVSVKNLPEEKEYDDEIRKLQAVYAEEIKGEISEATKKRNEILAKEIYLSVGRYDYFKRMKLIRKLMLVFTKAMINGEDINDETTRNDLFDQVAFRVRYIDETPDHLHGVCILNLASIKYYKDWCQIRGKKIATVFQDPMTSLNPIITIGKQITSIIMKHQEVSEAEARLKAIELMKKVGIPNAENRFDDYPFQYSGGMRQRIVIAIALSCQPKILICDEPTTALDVTIQAQILKLIKDLQKEFGYTIVFITHDLGVVANVADRVAVLYAGQIVELGKVDEVFYDPRHPYTWALLSSLPQLAQKNTKLYSITGTPPSLYNKIIGDAFAPRNPYCMKIDTLLEPPFFKVTDTHYAKTWLLEPNAPEVKKPDIIEDIHEKLIRAFNI
ncbi:MAG: ATP-binding cassette domain-containing protein [Lachnospiraceae bacterium]|nr:ATP-binding cassette domain-containing protein [Lachnospiraceae bacterium]